VTICTSILIVLIRGYQWLCSPLLPPACRFYPSCSEYAVQAIQYYGPVRGLLKAAWRLLRCNPLSRGGIDDPLPAENDAS
jgi:hypothetical protein